MSVKGTYPESKNGNFAVVDSISTPHPYCITSRHVSIAADQFCGMLGTAAIEAAEKQGARCGMRGCHLSYKEHEQALLIECRKDMKDESGKVDPELHEYLLSINEEATRNKYAGYAFTQPK